MTAFETPNPEKVGRMHADREGHGLQTLKDDKTFAVLVKCTGCGLQWANSQGMALAAINHYRREAMGLADEIESDE